MTNIAAALADHLALKERLLAEFPELAEDERTLLDTLDGISRLDEAIIAVIRSAEEDRTLVAALAIRIEELEERKARLEKRIERKREIAAEAMERGGLKKLTAPDFTLSLSAGAPKVIITDEGQIPAHLMVTPEPPAPKPDRRAIAGLLKSGVDVPGCVLSNPQPHLTVRRA